jgi:hypothetical protein
MFCTLLSIIFDLRYYKAYRQLRQKAITTPNNLLPKYLRITDKSGTAISDGAACLFSLLSWLFYSYFS